MSSALDPSLFVLVTAGAECGAEQRSLRRGGSEDHTQDRRGEQHAFHDESPHEVISRPVPLLPCE